MDCKQIMFVVQTQGPNSSGSPSSQHSTPQGGLAEPMQTDSNPADGAAAMTDGQGAAAQPASSTAAGSEAVSSGHGQNQSQMPPVAQQVRFSFDENSIHYKGTFLGNVDVHNSSILIKA